MNMKNYLKATFLLVLVSSVGLGRTTEKSQTIDSLLLQNVEALAGDENFSYTFCVGTSSVDCPINHSKVEYLIQGY